MKYRIFIAALLILIGNSILHSKEGKEVGKIGSVTAGSREIIVNIEIGKSIKMGEQLYVRVGGKAVIMEAWFPMQTIVKCKLAKSSAGYIKDIEKGMIVYLFDKSVLNENTEDTGKTDKSAGSVKKIGGVEFVYIPAATFEMGVNMPREERMYNGENIKHTVTLSAYWIGKYEITQAQYNAVMGKNPGSVIGNTLPVENISWNDAQEFCEKFSKKYGVKARLPYEAEWEYAARGGARTIYYWGDEIDGDYCWYKDNSSKKLHPVGKKKPNGFGLYDVSGNVCEWVYDWLDKNYYSVSPRVDPKGPSSGKKKILRGGSYVNLSMHPSPMRIDIRMVDNPDVKSEAWGAYGMRIVIE